MMTPAFAPISQGKNLRWSEANGFVITETLHSANLTLPEHSHELANIALVLRGSFTERFGPRKHDCAMRSILVKPPGESHSDQYGAFGARCLIIEVNPPRMKSIEPYSTIFERVEHFRDSALTLLGLQLYKELMTNDSTSPLAMESLILEMLVSASRPARAAKSTGHPRWLKDVVEIINEGFTRQVKLSELAKQAEVHPSHLARIFRVNYGCSIGDYLRRLRLNRAVNQLLHSDHSILQIAVECGFYDQSHFNRLFRRHLRMTPTAFRKTTQSAK